ncbi:MAG: carbohydrate kinase, partial [Flavobacteriaceae bacterium]|nr:carbohydrate kinase [Flavobacteriaceae bacterium]
NGYKIKVKDTVGAGDSFLAVLVHGIIKNQPLQETLDKACAMGALVAGSIGANPDITEEKLSIFMNNG